MLETSKKMFALLLLILCSSRLTVPAQSNDTAVINHFISSQESPKNGYQAEGIRTIVTGDLNHDGVPDTAVLYTLEGQNKTNNYLQYLAVFLRHNGRLAHVAHKEVGGKGYRSVELTSIKDQVMLLKTTGYADKDPSCCPTVEGSTRYVLNGTRLRELGSR